MALKLVLAAALLLACASAVSAKQAYAQCDVLDDQGQLIATYGTVNAGGNAYGPFYACDDCADACLHNAAGIPCSRYLIRTCGLVPCCGTGVLSNTFTVVCADVMTSFTNEAWCTFEDCGIICDKGGDIIADPHFTGFDGTSYFFEGKEDAVFSLLSTSEYQVNAHFGSIGPNRGRDTDIWMTGFGIRYKDNLAMTIKIAGNPEDIKLITEKGAGEDGEDLLRVTFPASMLKFEVNGKNVDHMRYSGNLLEGLPEEVIVYFPPETAVNPNDATDGAILVFKCPLLQLSIRKETEGAAHLDMSVLILDESLPMAGVLGQSMGWKKAGPGAKVVDGVFKGDDSAFIVQDGLLGSAAKNSLFKYQAYKPLVASSGEKLSASRRLLSEAEIAVPAGKEMATASHAVHRRMLA